MSFQTYTIFGENFIVHPPIVPHYGNYGNHITFLLLKSVKS